MSTPRWRKTAVNLDSGKNQAGTFFQPDLVVCDPTPLIASGFIFSGRVCGGPQVRCFADGRLFDMLKGPMGPHLEEVIERCLTIKSRLVYEDEFDTGPRQLLNFGHTFGHAVEKCSGYEVSHGKAVAIGMVVAGHIAEKMGVCSSDCCIKIKDMVTSLGLPHKTDLSDAELLSAMTSDKKRSLEEVTLVLPEEIGSCVLKKIPVKDLGSVMMNAMNDGRRQ